MHQSTKSKSEKDTLVKYTYDSFEYESTDIMEESTSEQPEYEMKSKTKNKDEFRWEDFEYWANKTPASERRTEVSLKYLQR